jgi:bifunctional non-homologous end joining protein LigD
MADCRWLKPELVAQIESLEWTEGSRLRHSRFVGLRDDKDPQDARREVPTISTPTVQVGRKK